MMSLAEAAQALGAPLGGADVRFEGVSTDSRSLRPGELFVALRGERFDGHDFLDAARRAGAAAALVDRAHAGSVPLPALAVEDTRLALGWLAKRWRARFAPVLIAITGSNGKTTTKEMLAAILRRHAGEERVLATAGNLNNEIGLPLTLLRLRAAHRYCAIELGMNHRGEIAYLADIARPSVALVNNAQREHLEFLRTVHEVAEENASVYDGLPPEGVAVLNADDPHAAYFRDRAGARRVVDFGLGASAAVSGGYALKPLSSELRVRTPQGECAATLSIPGLHNVRNALAAAACAHAAGIAPQAIGEGLGAFRPYAGRLQVKRSCAGGTLIDDSYNANPDSVRAAIDVLAAAAGRTVLVLGDMGEVGESGPEFHAEVGRYARERGVGALLALGAAAREAAEAYGAGGRHFGSLEELIGAAREAAAAGATLLVKGSRFMRMERVVAALAEGSAPVGGAR
ncbi:MAG: UDP-N-acetylmuramoyl-tripeptide--D-alanyl-D-alanine ligase [Betaproteobacteria bacterium]|nr:UDP-N-acetylmuramoyl-tripeptide--D-alanyl-D-alanine ligase [Betaproteobacteria bacterium]